MGSYRGYRGRWRTTTTSYLEEMAAENRNAIKAKRYETFPRVLFCRNRTLPSSKSRVYDIFRGRDNGAYGLNTTMKYLPVVVIIVEDLVVCISSLFKINESHLSKLRIG